MQIRRARRVARPLLAPAARRVVRLRRRPARQLRAEAVRPSPFRRASDRVASFDGLRLPMSASASPPAGPILVVPGCPRSCTHSGARWASSPLARGSRWSASRPLIGSRVPFSSRRPRQLLPASVPPSTFDVGRAARRRPQQGKRPPRRRSRVFQVSETRSSHARPAGPSTCSPKMTSGRCCSMSQNQAGHKCRSSANPPPLPAALKGWHGHEPVQTRRLSGQPAALRAALQTPIPAKK